MKIRSYAILLLCLVINPIAAMAHSRLPSFLADVKAPLYSFTSTGDVRFDPRWQPLDSPLTVTAYFERMQSLGVKRVYWRGEQDLDVVKYGRLRSEFPVRFDYWNKWQRRLNMDLKLNDVAVKEAHKRGIEIYMVQSLLDFGASADTGYAELPYPYEDKLRTDFPNFSPVDRTGFRHQAGPVEFAYPEMRSKFIQRMVGEVTQRGYDGVQLYTYFENFGTRFQGEFGFNDPIVNEYKRRYGVDIRAGEPDLKLWSDLRGEYVTTLLADLHKSLNSQKRKLAVCLSANNPDTMQEWPLETGRVNMALTMDWRKWTRDTLVDEISIMGGGDDKGVAFASQIIAVKGTKPLQITIFSERPFHAPFDALAPQGFAVICWSAPVATQPMERCTWDLPTIDALTSTDWKQRAQFLAEVESGNRQAIIAQIIPMIRDAHPIVRRQALNTLRKLHAMAAKPDAEAALDDPEESVRTAATLLLGDVGDANSVEAMFKSIAVRPVWMVNEAVVESVGKLGKQSASNLFTWSSHKSESVRQVVARAMAGLPVDFLIDRLRVLSHLDSSSIVRYHALRSLAATPNQKVIGDLLQALSDSAPMVNCAAAARLKELITVIPEWQKPDVLMALSKIYNQYGDKGGRSDGDWGYRPVGEALIAFGDTGLITLKSALAQTRDKSLAIRAHLSLNVPMNSGGYVTITPENAKAADKLAPRK